MMDSWSLLYDGQWDTYMMDSGTLIVLSDCRV